MAETRSTDKLQKSVSETCAESILENDMKRKHWGYAVRDSIARKIERSKQVAIKTYLVEQAAQERILAQNRQYKARLRTA